MDYHAIIVGARVAGSILASLLGDAGHRILLLDRASFPNDTLSTHLFRAPALRAFERIGVREQVEASVPRLTVNFNAVDGTVFPEPVDRPDDYSHYLCLRRITLDGILVRRAKETEGVELHEKAVATDLLWLRGRCVSVAWKEGERQYEARARAVVGADGVRSFLARRVTPRLEHEEPVRRAKNYPYFHGIPADDGPAAEFHYRGNQLAYSFPTDGNLTPLAGSMPIEQFDEFRRDPEGRLRQFLGSMSALSSRLPGAEREGPVRGTGSIPGYLRVPYGPGWALVGDSAMVMDPWSGQGIDQGSTGAVILAEHLSRFLPEDADWKTAMAAYHRERDEFSGRAYRRTCSFAPDLTPMTRRALDRRGPT